MWAIEGGIQLSLCVQSDLDNHVSDLGRKGRLSEKIQSAHDKGGTSIWDSNFLFQLVVKQQSRPTKEL